MDRTKALNYLWRPASIAVVGASSTQGRVGWTILNNLLKAGYQGKLYPVNPNLSEAAGLKAYPGVDSIPDDVDLAMIAVQPKLAADILGRCRTRNVRAAIVHSAGFSEVGEEGRRLEREIAAVARETGIVIVGPNTQGLINTDANLLALTLNFPVVSGGRGLAYVCQTGYFYWDWTFRDQEMGLCRAIDLGNMCDLDHNDVLESFGSDDSVRVVVVQAEEIRDGGRFMKLAGAVSRKKPVIVIKAGRTAAGACAIASHSGALAGNEAVYRAAFRQAGVFRATDMDELVDLTKTFAYLNPLPSGNRVAIVTFSGAAGSLAADDCEDSGLKVAALSPNTVDRVRQVLPGWAHVGNPIDLFQSPEVEQRRAHDVTMGALLDDPNVDCIMVVAMMNALNESFDVFETLMERATEGLKKPVVVSGVRDAKGLGQWSALDRAGVATYSSIRRAMRSLAAAHSRYLYLSSRG